MSKSEVLELLHTRRSVKAAEMIAPGPDKAQMDDILTAAARIPDHGMAVPFYFVVFEGRARDAAGEIVAKYFAEKNPDTDTDKIEAERQRFLRAPSVVGVVYRKRKGKHPLWEQMLTAGAVCQNLILAANAHGFVTQWLSEWYAYDDDVRAELGLDDLDILAGFIHIGSPPAEKPEDRNRPELSDVVTYWENGATLNKGDVYNRDKMDMPRLGFKH